MPKLIKRLKRINYPPEKLDIKLIVDIDDKFTIKAIEEEGISSATTATSKNQIFHLVKVDVGHVATKPRACNYAFEFARGELVVIYDAEDRPDPQQLRKAYSAYINSPLNTICVQAKLNFYNKRKNLLTKFFTLEYGFWFDFFLPGLVSLGIPIPLGGTSNHFISQSLKQVGSWDAFNVTEDAELGWRIARQKYRTVMVNSYTWEEANSQLKNWIRQRTRWQKGFFITFLVHCSSIKKMFEQLGNYKAITSLVVFFSNFAVPIINPILWIYFILWHGLPLLGFARIGFPIPEWLDFLGTFNLIFGNLTYIVIHFISAIKLGQKKLALYSIFMPLYWLFISIAGYRSFLQTLTKPFVWEKTKHGLK